MTDQMLERLGNNLAHMMDEFEKCAEPPLFLEDVEKLQKITEVIVGLERAIKIHASHDDDPPTTIINYPQQSGTVVPGTGPVITYGGHTIGTIEGISTTGSDSDFKVEGLSLEEWKDKTL